MSSRKQKPPTPVEALKHKDTRVNIPTEELREFVKTEEDTPAKMLYPRDPSLDPQLMWKGKDEQNLKDLEVPVVPIYIQEKIHPQALIENLRVTAKKGEPEPELMLFNDFNGVRDFRQKIDFYSHDAGSQPKWSNRMILGDSLLVMASLAEKEGLKGQVQMIYIDPPYGIEFGSNWQVSTRKRVVRDGRASDATRQPEQVRAFRDTWELGVHSYLAYLRDRLAIAYELLSESGSIFVQIGDENIHLVRALMDEIFGADNAHPVICFRKKMMPLMKEGGFESVCDYIVWYQKNKDRFKGSLKKLFKRQEIEGDPSWSWVQLPGGERRKLQRQKVGSYEGLPEGSKIFSTISMLPREYRENQDFVYEFEGTSFPPPADSCWSTTPEGMGRLAKAQRLHRSGKEGLRYIYFDDDYPVVRLTAAWMDTSPALQMRYVVETNTRVIERLMAVCTNPGDLVLDPTCGGGTTAYVAEQFGRRWITIDTSRVALALSRYRLMGALFPYYFLADSFEGKQKEGEISGIAVNPTKTARDIKQGFVYERVPHVTLGDIANNTEIDDIYAGFQARLESIRSDLNDILKRNWANWEVPRETDKLWSNEAIKLHGEWWRLKQARQDEIDTSIARRTDREYLFDRPYVDPGIVRVAGPFTVESISPHRVPPSEESRPASEIEATRGNGGGQFVTTILDNLRKAGVQNTKRGERLTFHRLEPYAGAWLQAAGEFTDAAGKTRRVAVSIGPEHGTVGPNQIQDAAKEAVRGIGFDFLLVLGFSFDAHASETAREISPVDMKLEDGFVAAWEEQYGRLPVLLVRMNPDLSMGDELLKKTGAGNLFMVFGEPDIRIDRTQDGKVALEILGLDVYDPTTGEVRNSTTDDIACWFIDTEYNEESFFVRHAYFTGAADPYEKLKRALRADIDEAAWRTLYSTKSRPFDPPKSGKIAVKVINHYGDEVLKIYELELK